MTIACDLDGVLAEYNMPTHHLFSKWGPMRPMLGDPDRWFWYDAYGATAEMIAAATAEQTVDWWATLPKHRDFTPRVAALLTELHARTELTFVSARSCPREASLRWLATHLPELDGPQVIHTPRKALLLSALQPDHYLDDAWTLVRDYLQLMPQAAARTHLVERRYNQREMAPSPRREIGRAHV